MAWPPRVSAPRFASGATANVTAAPLLISGAHTRMHARAHACVHRRARARRARPSCVRLRVLTVRIACARTHARAQRPADVEESRQGLPIIDMEQEIMEAIAGNLVTVLCGATGSGKTTQLPQFLFEAGYGDAQCAAHPGGIAVTQPRRVAASAGARRVATEMGLKLGEEVGYQVRGRVAAGMHTTVLACARVLGGEQRVRVGVRVSVSVCGSVVGKSEAERERAAASIQGAFTNSAP